MDEWEKKSSRLSKMGDQLLVNRRDIYVVASDNNNNNKDTTSEKCTRICTLSDIYPGCPKRRRTSAEELIGVAAK